MRILALDLGDVWVGTALSDPLGIVCRPLKTVKRGELIAFLTTAIDQHDVSKILVGFPAGTDGQETEQSKKTYEFFLRCREQFPFVTWELLDEYLTSQLATQHQQTVKRQRLSSQSKLESHSLAAAFLLKDYLYSTRQVSEEDDRLID